MGEANEWEWPGNPLGFVCPAWQRDDYIEISVLVWARLLPDWESDADTSELVWNDNTPARCGNCEWSSQVKDLRPTAN